MQLGIIIVGHNRKGITIINKNDLSIIQTVKPNYYCPTSLAISNDGKQFVCWNNHGTIDQWNLEDLTHETIISTCELDKYCCSGGVITYLSNNTILVKTSKDVYFTRPMEIDDEDRTKSLLHIVDISNKKILNEWLLEKDYNQINLKDNLLICSSGSGKCIDIYDYFTHKLLHRFEINFPAYSAQIQGDFLYCCGYSNSVHVFDVKTKALIANFTTEGNQINEFAITKDQKYLVVPEYTGNNYVGSLLYFDINSQVCLKRLSCGKFLMGVIIDENQKNILAIGAYQINSFHYTPDQPDEILSLTKLCVESLRKNLSFFSSRELTEKERSVLDQHFDFDDETAEKIDEPIRKEESLPEEKIKQEEPSKSNRCIMM